MLGIKINGRFLALSPDTSLTFEDRHPAELLSTGADTLAGSYTLPMKIPVEGNESLIGHINRLDVDSILLQDEYCEIWADGLLFKTGKATIKGASNTTANLFIVFNEVKELTAVHLSALDLGGDRAIGDTTAERLAHALDTATNPLDHDYIFCPVLNPAFYPEGDAPPEFFPTSKYQNKWNHTVNKFVENDYAPATPFIRVDYLLRRIFSHIGYTLDNQWQVTDELKLMLLYNNFNISSLDDEEFEEWTSTINLVNHVPYRQALDFLKAVITTYALGLFPDPDTKTMLLIPFRDLIRAPVVEDWTSKASAEWGYDTDRDFISKFRFDIDELDDLSVDWSGVIYPQNIVQGEGLTARIMHAAEEYLLRYAIADNTYYFIPIDPTFQARHIAQDQKPVVKTGSDIEYISPLIPMWNSWDITLDGDIDDTIPFQEWMIPHIRHRGYIPGPSSIKTTCSSFRTMIYRGFQPADEGIDSPYPMASSTPYNIRGELIGAQSLLWDGTYGIYNTHWKLLYELHRSKKTVVRTLQMSIADMINFKYQNKYRIENQNVFVLRRRYTLSNSSRGMYKVETTMITTL